MRSPGTRGGPDSEYPLLFDRTVHGIAFLQARPGQGRERGVYRILRTNPAFSRITGLAALDLVDRTLPEVLGDVAELCRPCAAAGRSAEPISVELYVARLDRHIEVTLCRLDENLCAALLRDVTAQVLARQALASANRDLSESNRCLAQKQRELEEFVSVVSHDLKSPLIAIQGFVRLLAERMRSHLRAREVDYFDRILGNVRQMETRLNELLTLARLGRLATTTERIDTQALIDEILVDFSVRAQAKRVRLIRTGPLPAVAGSPQGIREVFENLIDNAIKYMPPRSDARVEIGYDEAVTSPTGARGAFYVRDNGAGIAPEHRERIFEMFHRGPHPGGNRDGAGLGLVIVRRVVESHRGRVWVDATPGSGATFFLTLPSAPVATAEGLVEHARR